MTIARPKSRCDAADRQAQQNTTMAELHDEVASGTRRLVEADGQARAEIVAVHRDLQAERSRLDSGWTDLEQERREIARERRTESMLVPAIEVGGGLMLLIVLLGYCWYALVRLRSGDSVDADLTALLVEELLADGRQDLSFDDSAARHCTFSRRASKAELIVGLAY